MVDSVTKKELKELAELIERGFEAVSAEVKGVDVKVDHLAGEMNDCFA